MLNLGQRHCTNTVHVQGMKIAAQITVHCYWFVCLIAALIYRRFSPSQFARHPYRAPLNSPNHPFVKVWLKSQRL
jgi:hypothetical protein